MIAVMILGYIENLPFGVVPWVSVVSEDFLFTLVSVSIVRM